LPLTPKGKTILTAMIKEYKKKGYDKKKGKSVFYAMENAGKLKGIVKK